VSKKKYLQIVEHYEECLRKHGDTYRGVDWPSRKDLETRYRVMLDIIRRGDRRPISLLDFGCGAAHLRSYIRKTGKKGIRYQGLDLSKEFVQLCRKKFPKDTFYCVDALRPSSKLPAFDYAVMNGVFTEKRGMKQKEMFLYMQKLLTKVFLRSRKGVAFNVMSKQVDWELPAAFHLGVDELSKFLTKKLTRNFVIRHDYGLYEYTVYLYK
jgi:SAM-dependent methyltransferase